MTTAQWQVSTDALVMIAWLARQGHTESLWTFATTCCRRSWNELPGDAFRRVIEHVEQVGTHDLDDRLAEVTRLLSKLERRFRKATGDSEQTRLSRQIAVGRLVLAFEQQDGAGMADSISRDMVGLADDPEAEGRVQAELLRRLVPDPSSIAEPAQPGGEEARNGS